jgi:hypothetical protein
VIGCFCSFSHTATNRSAFVASFFFFTWVFQPRGDSGHFSDPPAFRRFPVNWLSGYNCKLFVSFFFWWCYFICWNLLILGFFTALFETCYFLGFSLRGLGLLTFMVVGYSQLLCSNLCRNLLIWYNFWLMLFQFLFLLYLFFVAANDLGI